MKKKDKAQKEHTQLSSKRYIPGFPPVFFYYGINGDEWSVSDGMILGKRAYQISRFGDILKKS